MSKIPYWSHSVRDRVTYIEEEGGKVIATFPSGMEAVAIHLCKKHNEAINQVTKEEKKDE